MNKTPRNALIALVLILAAGGVGGMLLLNRGTESEKLGTVRMGSFSVAIDYAPYLVAKEMHWFEESLKDEGIAIEYTTFQSLPPINEAFATGDIDVVLEAEVPAIIGRAGGVELQVAAMSSTLSAPNLLVRPAANISTFADLKGKKIGVLAGTGYHYALLNGLEAVGLKRNDVSIIDMMPPDAKAAFATNTIDAWAVWPPFPEQELLSGQAAEVPGLDARVQVIMVAREAFATEHPQTLAKLVAALDRAKKWIAQNPDEAQRLVSKSLDLPLEVVQAAWKKNDFDAVLSPEVVADMQAKADFLKSEGFIKKSINIRSDMIIREEDSVRALGDEPTSGKSGAAVFYGLGQ